jgi:hypothetical protein
MRRIIQKPRTVGARSLSRLVLATLVAGVLLLAVTPAQAATPEQACKSGKNKTAGKYAACRENAEAKRAAGGETSKYNDAIDKCESKFSTAWDKLEAKALAASASCPGDDTPIKGQTSAYTDRVAAQVAGTRFKDNLDGTVTDHATGLQWERKGNLDGTANLTDPHDADNEYQWSGSPPWDDPNGAAFTDFLAELNGCESADGITITGGFADHCDWRLPSIAELKTIVDMSTPGCGTGPLCIDTVVFGPTGGAGYWSSTTDSAFPGVAWAFDFSDATAYGDNKNSQLVIVRAVRTVL